MKISHKNSEFIYKSKDIELKKTIKKYFESKQSKTIICSRLKKFQKKIRIRFVLFDALKKYIEKI